MTKRVAGIIAIIIILAGVVVFLINFKDYDFQNIIQNATPTPQTSMSGITFPKEGDTLISGQKYTLKWSKGEGQTQIFLVNAALESQGESVAVSDRIYNVKDSGTYEYTVSENLTPGKYRFEIGNLTSGVFSIVKKESEAISDCQPSNLEAKISLSPGAGNVYGDLTIKNVGDNPCSLDLGNSLNVEYDNSIKNITSSLKTKPSLGLFTLNPNSMVYSQVHYPNGPQCNGATKSVNVKFAYKINSGSTVVFKNPQGSEAQSVNACQGSSDMTQIDLWSFSKSKITP
jgi:hypothetical protein